tara:strand:- start:627 stop:740 length:114 start_codon:yes stop_codon:yes gene_type:complete
MVRKQRRIRICALELIASQGFEAMSMRVALPPLSACS